MAAGNPTPSAKFEIAGRNRRSTPIVLAARVAHGGGGMKTLAAGPGFDCKFVLNPTRSRNRGRATIGVDSPRSVNSPGLHSASDSTWCIHPSGCYKPGGVIVSTGIEGSTGETFPRLIWESTARRRGQFSQSAPRCFDAPANLHSLCRRRSDGYSCLKNLGIFRQFVLSLWSRSVLIDVNTFDFWILDCHLPQL